MNDFLLNPFVLSAFSLWLYMTMLFFIALIKKDNSIADIGYGVAFIVVSYACLFFGANPIGYTLSFVEFLLFLLVTIWGTRLALRIYLKNKGKPEDFRYAKWRAEWKFFYLRSYLQVFMLQGIIVYLISLPILLVTNMSGVDNTNILLLSAGTCIWLIGFFFETFGDHQLDKFLKSPESRGHLMTTGLWRYTRHPNYFGESTMWWGIFLIAFSTGHDLWIFALISPILITTLLLKVSGIPLLEAKMSQHSEWPEYASKTNAFLPWFQKK